jgi:hypothetical protein
MKHTITLIIISLLCLSCRGVFFNEDISLSVSFISKLDHKATIGPIRHFNQYFDIERDNIFFIPDKGYYNQGFIIQNHDTCFDIWYLDSSGVIYGSVHFDISDMNNKEPNCLFETLNGYPRHLFCVNYDGEYTRYKVIIFDGDYLYDDGEQDISSRIYDDFSSTLYFSNYPTINGVYISPVDNRLYIFFLSDDMGENRYYEVSYAFASGTDITEPSSPYGSSYIILNDSIYHDLYYSHDVTRNRSLASYPEGTSFKTYSWKSDLVHQKVPIDDPGKHLLSSGEIFSYQNGIARGFSIAGDELFITGKGDVRFCYEYCDGNGRYHSLFTYTTLKMEEHDCSIDSVTFYVYSIPSDKMSDIN